MTPDTFLLSLRPDVPVSGWNQIQRATAPPDNAGHGKAVAVALGVILSAPHWLTTPLDVTDVVRMDKQPLVYAIRADSVVSVEAGVLHPHGDLAVIDARDGRTVVTILGSSGTEVLLDFNQADVTAWDASAAPYRFQDSSEAEQSAFPEVDAIAWLAGANAAEWLVDALADLADSPSPVDRVAAAGILLRFGSDLGEVPESGARMWLNRLGSEDVSTVQQLALVRADRLAQDIEVMDGVPASVRSDHARNIIRERDELQSVRRALRVASAADELSRTLDDIDRRAMLHASTFSDLLPSREEDPNGERWDEVAWREPEAWWVGDE